MKTFNLCKVFSLFFQSQKKLQVNKQPIKKTDFKVYLLYYFFSKSQKKFNNSFKVNTITIPKNGK
jgi:hypothetical protein